MRTLIHCFLAALFTSWALAVPDLNSKFWPSMANALNAGMLLSYGLESMRRRREFRNSKKGGWF